MYICVIIVSMIHKNILPSEKRNVSESYFFLSIQRVEISCCIMYFLGTIAKFSQTVENQERF